MIGAEGMEVETSPGGKVTIAIGDAWVGYTPEEARLAADALRLAIFKAAREAEKVYFLEEVSWDEGAYAVATRDPDTRGKSPWALADGTAVIAICDVPEQAQSIVDALNEAEERI